MMSKNNNEERKCKICGKTIVGKNKTGICSACKKKAGDTGVTVMGVLALIGGAIWRDHPKLCVNLRCGVE